ncbi:MAG: GDSL-type esterase/lipase family protein [Candidatus Eisenbacteria bacterium]
MRPRRLLGEARTAATSTLLVFLVLESMIRIAYYARNRAVDAVVLPYVTGQKYGPIPPWTDDLRILVRDRDLIWKARPGLERRYVDVFSPVHSEEDRYSLLRSFIPRIPEAIRENPVWEISLNSDGFRDREIVRAKPPSLFRVVCLGDSWTFGANVAESETYPARLERLFEEGMPEMESEVLNLGVLGYSSFQGLQLMKSFALDLDPDLLLLGFGMNDASVSGYRDKDMPAMEKKEPSLEDRIHALPEKLELFKLVRYAALLMKHEPDSLARQLAGAKRRIGEPSPPAQAGRAAVGDAAAEAPPEEVDYGELEPWTRVSPEDYRENTKEMIRLARETEIPVLVLFNELWVESPYRAVLEEAAAEEGVPFVDGSRIVADAREEKERELEETLLLRPENAGSAPPGMPAVGSAPEGERDEVEVVFRLYQGERSAPRGFAIVGPHPALGGLVPNKTHLRDDGAGGDQKAGDRVWSYAASFPRGTRLPYVYTNGGEEGRWTGLDIPALRYFEVKAGFPGERLYLSVETFGEICMQADSWHTNAEGYARIAKAVFEALSEASMLPSSPPDRPADGSR